MLCKLNQIVQNMLIMRTNQIMQKFLQISNYANTQIIELCKLFKLCKLCNICKLCKWDKWCKLVKYWSQMHLQSGASGLDGWVWDGSLGGLRHRAPYGATLITTFSAIFINNIIVFKVQSQLIDALSLAGIPRQELVLPGKIEPEIARWFCSTLSPLTTDELKMVLFWLSHR